MSHNEHEVWVQQLLGQMTRDAPTGFSKVTAGQVIRADRELFTLMAQELQGPLQPDARGELPMDKKLRELRTDPRVTMFLLPLPKARFYQGHREGTGFLQYSKGDNTDTSETAKEGTSIGEGEVHVPPGVAWFPTERPFREPNLLGFQPEGGLQERSQQRSL